MKESAGEFVDGGDDGRKYGRHDHEPRERREPGDDDHVGFERGQDGSGDRDPDRESLAKWVIRAHEPPGEQRRAIPAR